MSEVRLSLKHGFNPCRSLDLIAARISFRSSARNPSLFLKKKRVLLILAFWTLDIAPLPAVLRQEAAQPTVACWQVLKPDRRDGARWIPKVFQPTASPFFVFAFPLFSSFIVRSITQDWVLSRSKLDRFNGFHANAKAKLF